MKDLEPIFNEIARGISNFDIFSIKEITFEVYRESRMEEGLEVPSSFNGMRVYVDGEEIYDVILKANSEYGLLSYSSVKRPKTSAEFSIHFTNFIINTLFSGFEHFEYKIKKVFKSNIYIHLLEIPDDFLVYMPPTNALQELQINYAVNEHQLMLKQQQNPSEDFSNEFKVLREVFETEIKKFSNKN